MSTPQPPAEEPSEARIANELHRRFCSDVPNDGTYTLALNETETIRFFKEMERLVSEALSSRDALIVQMGERIREIEKFIGKMADVKSSSAISREAAALLGQTEDEA